MEVTNKEQGPAKLKALLAEHADLVGLMRDRMLGKGETAQRPSGEMTHCPMMGNSEKLSPN
jgi:hypothetical protein